MKVISLSLDKKIFDPSSQVAQRAIFLGSHLDKYIILVPGLNKKIELSSKVLALGIGGFSKFQALLNTKSRLTSLLKAESFDLLTVQDTAFLAFLGLKIAKKFALKLEIQVHGFEKGGFLRDYLAKKVLVGADLVRVVSQRLRDYLIKECSVGAEKIYIAPVAINQNNLIDSHTLDLHKIYPEHFIFLTVGRLVPVKNIALQLQAVKSLVDRQKVKLIVVGDGPEKDNLKKLANDLNIREQIIFFGWQEKLGDLYHSADCLLLTSDSEGYGLVAVEAKNCHLPVIMTDVGCAGEIIKNNIHGLVVPVGDQDSLVQAMEKMRQADFYQTIKNNLKQEKKVDNQETFTVILQKWQTIKK